MSDWATGWFGLGGALLGGGLTFATTAWKDCREETRRERDQTRTDRTELRNANKQAAKRALKKLARAGSLLGYQYEAGEPDADLDDDSDEDDYEYYEAALERQQEMDEEIEHLLVQSLVDVQEIHAVAVREDLTDVIEMARGFGFFSYGEEDRFKLGDALEDAAKALLGAVIRVEPGAQMDHELLAEISRLDGLIEARSRRHQPRRGAVDG